MSQKDTVFLAQLYLLKVFFKRVVFNQMKIVQKASPYDERRMLT